MRRKKRTNSQTKNRFRFVFGLGPGRRKPVHGKMSACTAPKYVARNASYIVRMRLILCKYVLYCAPQIGAPENGAHEDEAPKMKLEIAHGGAAKQVQAAKHRSSSYNLISCTTIWCSNMQKILSSVPTGSFHMVH